MKTRKAPRSELEITILKQADKPSKKVLSVSFFTMEDAYKKVEKYDVLEEYMLKLAGNFMTDSKELGLMLMYSYDYMHLTHICVSEFLDNGKINETNILKLKAAIF